MRRIFTFMLPLLTGIIALSAMASPARAESGIHDDADLFKSSTRTAAKSLIQQIHAKSGHEVFVATFPSISADQESVLQNKGKQRFYADWSVDVGRQFGVQGLVILIVKDPAHLQIAVGNRTQKEAFSLDNRDEMYKKMVPPLEQNDFDTALLTGLGFINDRINAKAGYAPNAGTANVPTTPGYATPRSVSPISTSGGGSWGGLVCLGIGAILVVAIVIGVASRNRGYNAGYGAPPPGGYPPGYGGYGSGGYYGGGGGGGFGRGLLGGLLGGALGAWGYERFSQGGNQSSNYFPPQGAPPDSTGDTDYSSTGGDIGSSSSGSDFGGSSDSSTSDFGGGGDTGGGGGGGDFGGGGDSGGGGSAGGDF